MLNAQSVHRSYNPLRRYTTYECGVSVSATNGNFEKLTISIINGFSMNASN